MDLMIDIGNTRIKYATIVSGQIKIKGVCAKNEIEKTIKNFSNTIDRVMISSVGDVSQDTWNKINKKSIKSYHLNPQMKLPFNNQYESKETLGSDRIALISGGILKFPKKDLLVIDLGSCITFDFVDAQKNYLGGAISPGIKMRLKALNRFTKDLPLLDFEESRRLIGKTTKQSILSGVYNGVLKELKGTIEEYKLRYPKMEVVLTGGDASLFDKKLKNGIFVDEDLLLKGMYSILIKNADK